MSSLKLILIIQVKLNFHWNKSSYFLKVISKTPKKISQKSETYFSSLKFDSDDDFAAKNDTLQVNYATCDCLFCSSARILHQNTSAIMAKVVFDPNLSQLFVSS